MDLFVATILTDTNVVGKPWRAQFEASCRYHRVPIVQLQVGDSYSPATHGNTKLKALMGECLARRSRKTHVVFVDGFDSIFLDSIDELATRFKELDHQFVVSGSVNLDPAKELIASFPYSESGSPFRFPNSGFFIAEIDYFMALMKRFSFGEQDQCGPFNDREWFQFIYASCSWAIKVDTESVLSITLDKAERYFEVNGVRVVNKISGKAPVVVHGSGGFDLSPVFEQLSSGGARYVRPNLGQKFEYVEHKIHRAFLGRGRKSKPSELPISSKATPMFTLSAREFAENYAAAWKPDSLDHAKALCAGDCVGNFDMSGLEVVERFSGLLAPGYVAIDLGSGIGRITKPLSRRCDRVIALDASSWMKPYFESYCSGIQNVEFMDLFRPGFNIADDSVDFAISWNTFHHIDYHDVQLLLKELNRVLKLERTLVANFPNVKSNRFFSAYDGLNSKKGEGRYRPYTKELVTILLDRAGFGVDSVDEEDGGEIVAKVKKVSVVSGRSRRRNVHAGTQSFYHSGDAGDIVYAMLTIKELGGGKVFLGPDCGTKYGFKCRVTMSPEATDNIRLLLLAQPYISDVSYAEFVPAALDYNLNEFRVFLHEKRQGEYWKDPLYKGPVSLCRVHLDTFGIKGTNEEEPWIVVDSPYEVPGKPVAVARSHRYRCEHFPWKKLVEKYGSLMFFVGTDDEHRDFVSKFGNLEKAATSSLMDVARFIAGSKVFIGNQSCPFAVAEGLKKNSVQETWEYDPNCLFNRPNALYDENRLDVISEFIDRKLTDPGYSPRTKSELIVCTTVSMAKIQAFELMVKSLRLFNGTIHVVAICDGAAFNAICEEREKFMGVIPIRSLELAVLEAKCEAIKIAATFSKTVVFADCNTLFTGKIDLPDGSQYTIGLSPYYAQFANEVRGKFNPGFIVVRSFAADDFAEWFSKNRGQLDIVPDTFENVALLGDSYSVGHWRDRVPEGVVAVNVDAFDKSTANARKVKFRDLVQNFIESSTTSGMKILRTWVNMAR